MSTIDINKTFVSTNKNSYSIPSEHISSLKQSVLETFENSKYSSINKQTPLVIFFFEMLAMFLFVYGITCSKAKTPNAQAFISAVIAVAISARLTGANINISITLSNVLRKENKYQTRMLWLYSLA